MATKGNKETGYVHDINDGGLDKSDKRRNGQKGTSLKDYKRETDRQTKTDRERQRQNSKDLLWIGYRERGRGIKTDT